MVVRSTDYNTLIESMRFNARNEREKRLVQILLQTFEETMDGTIKNILKTVNVAGQYRSIRICR